MLDRGGISDLDLPKERDGRATTQLVLRVYAVDNSGPVGALVEQFAEGGKSQGTRAVSGRNFTFTVRPPSHILFVRRWPT